MRKILIIGIGAGNPDYITVQAINALNQVDVFFIPDKGAEKAALREHRTSICERFIENKTYRTVQYKTPQRANLAENYRMSVEEWHASLEANFESLFSKELSEDGCGAFLVWGDPTLYDSTLRIVEKIRLKGFELEYQLIPGISAIQALAAQHRIALNRIGEPVLITTGRRLAEGIPSDIGDVLVMLDGEQTFKQIPAGDLDIYWGAYLGTQDEILISGKLTQVMDEIEQIRRKAREEHGWIMDTYLLRKPEKS